MPSHIGIAGIVKVENDVRSVEKDSIGIKTSIRIALIQFYKDFFELPGEEWIEEEIQKRLSQVPAKN